jgi:chemotaxis protein methyltransferase CheR
MGIPARKSLNLVPLPEKVFNKIGSFIEREYGIKMPPVKRIMLESRLQKRLRALRFESFEEYEHFVFCAVNGKEELVTMVNIATTNKTDFFREPKHFDFLSQTAIPALNDLYSSGTKRAFRAWSAGCSSGEEPYTMAMLLHGHADKLDGFKYKVLATDLSTQVLDSAKEAVYDEEKIAPVPLEMKVKHLLRSKDKSKGLVKIAKHLRDNIKFQRLNFMDTTYEITDNMDVIFCRNVIIYFDRQTQERILNRLINHLLPGGYLFLGHSETLNGLDIDMKLVSPTTYRKPL